MGIEFKGHEFEWFDTRCRFCGMRREDAYRSDRPCSGRAPDDDDSQNSSRYCATGPAGGSTE